ncbi:hypothetical protein diail_3989 [Diaporthe ilicicola]|nr:hypothetical protein diail_3989 [Diaporthe ilicicola]
MWEYLQGYTDHFQLRSHIHLSTHAPAVARDGERWAAEFVTKDHLEHLRREYFDKVAVANGSFTKPKWHELPGIEHFTGRTLHAINFHRPETFNSAQDVACGLSAHFEQLYVSHRNGVVFNLVPDDMQLPRYDPKGAVIDTSLTVNLTKILLFATTWFPSLLNWLLEKIMVATSKAAFPKVKKSWNIFPAPSFATTAPVIADEIYPLLESGFCEPVAAVSRIMGAKSIELKDGRVLEDIDAIICTTGYDLAAPFFDKEHNPYLVPGSIPYMYRGTFPLHEDFKVRHMLAFIGHAAVSFPGFVQHEFIIMAVSQIWCGKSSLLPLDDMNKGYRGFLEWRQNLLKQQKAEATFYTLTQPLADHMEWMEDAAGTAVFYHFGWFNRKAWSFWWHGRKLYNLCANGLFTPSIWRLFETGKRMAWPQAREHIFLDNEASRAQVRARLGKLKLAESKKTL